MDYSKQANQRKRLQKEVDQQRLVSKIWLNILRIACILVLAAVFIVGGLLLGGFMGIIDDAPVQDEYAINNFTSYIYDADGNEMTPIYTSVLRAEVTIDQIPEHMQHAVVAIEDSRFYQHNGIDIEGILRSGVRILQDGDIEGGSTITQQVIKNLALTSDTAMTRKIQEWYMALQYEYDLTQEMGKTAAKQHILETYLNYVNFGNGNYGVQSASRYYFGKDVSDITIAESAVLAGVLNAPSYYDPVAEPVACRQRQLLVLEQMYNQGYITEEEYQSARNEDVFALIRENTSEDPEEEETSDVRYTYFQEAAIQQVQEDLAEKLNISEEAAFNQVYYGGLQIFLSQDQSIQDTVDYVVDNVNDIQYYGNYYQLNYALSIYSEDRTVYENFGLYNLLYDTEQEALDAIDSYRAETLAEYGLTPEDEDRYEENYTITLEPQLSVVIMDYRSGQVKAISAGRGEKTTDFPLNRATDTTRNPGSTFKVLSAFAPALDGAGKTAATVYDDVPLNPLETGGWCPVNSWATTIYYGFSTIRQGISWSMNIVAARCIMDIGPDLGYQYATERFGITTLETEDIAATMALGGLANGVSNLELSGAFSAIANDGTYIEPTFYTRVLDHDGNVLLDKTMEGEDVNTHEALSEQNAWIVEDMMRDTVEDSVYGTATTLRVSGGMPIAAKTGTTDDNWDYWLSAWTPYYLCTLWLGFDMQSYSGNYDSLSSPNLTNIRSNLWNAIMQPIHEDLEYQNFGDPPEGVTTAYVCPKSGLLATSSCSNAYTEYFAEGTVPTSYCNVHTSVAVCSITGLSPSSTCPVTYQSGVKRDQDLNELAQILAQRNPSLGFQPSYVRDYVPQPTAVCPGHYTEPDTSTGSDSSSGSNSSGGSESSGSTSGGGGSGGGSDSGSGTGTGSGEDTQAGG